MFLTVVFNFQKCIQQSYDKCFFVLFLYEKMNMMSFSPYLVNSSSSDQTSAQFSHHLQKRYVSYVLFFHRLKFRKKFELPSCVVATTRQYVFFQCVERKSKKCSFHPCSRHRHHLRQQHLN